MEPSGARTATFCVQQEAIPTLLRSLFWRGSGILHRTGCDEARVEGGPELSLRSISSVFLRFDKRIAKASKLPSTRIDAASPTEVIAIEMDGGDRASELADPPVSPLRDSTHAIRPEPLQYGTVILALVEGSADGFVHWTAGLASCRWATGLSGRLRGGPGISLAEGLALLRCGLLLALEHAKGHAYIQAGVQSLGG
ncbi:hypothetical protein TgHK011_002507 [Trichoderma gracile]|nr:hypothetical protein TgHK011_002507 [Trichoderma gracile]